MNLVQAIEGGVTLHVLQVASLGAATSFAICVLLVITKRWHGRFTIDSAKGIQKFHSVPTPRIGGLSIVLGLIVSCDKAPSDIKQLLIPIVFAGMPAFFMGLLEDVTKRVGVQERLLATMASGLLACYITGYSLTRVDTWGVDWLLENGLVVSVIFTAFAVGGVANSINIIDGFNGLASTTSMLAFLGYALIALQVGDSSLAGVALVLCACVSGFFWVNWPLGKIFLGDGGSYFVGFALAWVAILLVERNPSVSAFSALLLLTHPVSEVLFSIFRRRVKRMNPSHPDRLHFHSLIKQRYVRRWFPSMSMNIRNSITGAMVGFMTLIAIVLAFFVFESKLFSMLAFLVLFIGYLALYLRIVRFRWF